MIPSTAIFRQTASTLRGSAVRPLARSSAATIAPVASVKNIGLGVAGRRWNTQEQRGGKSKLVFRFGLRDIPVELYPMAFVVGAACVGAAIAVGRHFYFDGLRVGPGGRPDNKDGKQLD